jgi:hypothetical protein
MPSFRMHASFLEGCPAVGDLAVLLLAHGFPEEGGTGVAAVEHCMTSVEALLAIAGEANIKQYDTKGKSEKKVGVRKHAIYVFRVFPLDEGHGFLEVYDGGASAAKNVCSFLTTEFAAGIASVPIELDLISTFKKLQELSGNAEITEATIHGYQAADNNRGTYKAKFTNSGDAVAFLEALPLEPVKDEEGNIVTPASEIRQIKCKWKCGKKNILIRTTINPNGSLTSTGREEVEDEVRSMMRLLVGCNLPEIVA